MINTKELEIIGEFHGDFVVLLPLVHPNNTIEITRFSSGGALTPAIGHRGLGQNESSHIRMIHSILIKGENTILSFVTANKFGFQCIEFDVQLTRDHVPIIYHDFDAPVDGFNIPIDSLTLKEFKELHKSQRKSGRKFNSFISHPKGNSNLRNSNDNLVWKKENLELLDNETYRIKRLQTRIGFTYPIPFPHYKR